MSLFWPVGPDQTKASLRPSGEKALNSSLPPKRENGLALQTTGGCDALIRVRAAVASKEAPSRPTASWSGVLPRSQFGRRCGGRDGGRGEGSSSLNDSGFAVPGMKGLEVSRNSNCAT